VSKYEIAADIKSARILSLPRLFTEEEVAEALGCARDTVRRERKRDRLGFTKLGSRIRFTEAQIATYLESQATEPCTTTKHASAKSTAIGSASDQIAQPGVEPGSIRESDRHDAHHSAQMILTKPNSRSPPG
jgi:excisionase family DNA binding protein